MCDGAGEGARERSVKELLPHPRNILELPVRNVLFVGSWLDGEEDKRD